MTIEVPNFNEYDALGDASFQNFQPGQAYIVSLTEAETVVIGKAADLKAAVFTATALDAGDSAVAAGDSVLLTVNAAGTAVYVTGGANANIEVDNDGTLDALADHLKFGVTSAGNLSVRSDDGTVEVLLVRLA